MYSILKIWLRIALQFYCKAIRIEGISADISRPCIIASNHPNSFFDAIIIACCYPKQIHFLARGDAFNKPWAAWILRRLNLIPIYRLEEGKEFLGNNEQSFAACIGVFRKGGTVIIFPEGLSRHEERLRPLRKGAARLAWLAWQKQRIDDLVIQPVSLSYHSFSGVPKRTIIEFDQPILSGDLPDTQEALFYNHFNDRLKHGIENGIINPERVAGLTSFQVNSFQKILLAIPALIGYLTHRWFYLLWRNFVAKKTADTVFYDSVLFAAMMLTYPLLILLITVTCVIITSNSLFWLLLIGLPFAAWCYKTYHR